MSCALKRAEEEKVSYWKGRFPVMVVAHRGFSGAPPENTLAAFRKAIEVGSDMIELDIQLSKDGKIVVIHDETLERTTNGRGRVADLTFRELRDLDAGSWFDAQFSGEKIPTLQEVLELAKGKALVNIEIKNPSHGKYPIADLAAKVLRMVRDERMLTRVIFSSFNPASLEYIRNHEPRAWVALLFHRDWNSLTDLPGEKEYEVLNLRNSYLSKAKIAKIHQEGKRVNVYTVNSEEELEQFVNWGADGLITNHPERLIRVLKSRTP